jgi:hypothetical protein
MPIDLPPALTKKIGPLPVWAWGAVALGLIGVYLYSRSRPAKDTSAVTFSGADAGMVTADDGSSFEGLTGGGAGNLGNGTGGVYGSGGGGGDYTYYPPPPVYEGTPPTYEPAPGPTVLTQAPATTTVTPTKQTSFQWGGKTWRKGDLAAFRKWLTSHGTSYKTWASNHPKAAMDVFGTMT